MKRVHNLALRHKINTQSLTESRLHKEEENGRESRRKQLRDWSLGRAGACRLDSYSYKELSTKKQQRTEVFPGPEPGWERRNSSVRLIRAEDNRRGVTTISIQF